MTKGKVSVGLGEAWFWVKKAEKVLREKTGLKEIFYGTLNIELEKPYKFKDPDYIIQKEEYDGEEKVYIKRCELNGHQVYAVRSAINEEERGEHPLTILEIISDINLREKFNLKDEDIVNIDI